jgi:hypothetical protein
MFKETIAGDPVFRRFFQKKLLLYIVPNVFFNTCVPYFTFKNMDAVYLFQGELCFARFLLPMAFFLPFMITFDILKKTAVLARQGKIHLMLPHEINANKFFFRMAGINGGITLAVVLLVSLLAQFFTPSGYGFDGTSLSILMGLLAGMLTIVFTILPLMRVLSRCGHSSL